MINFISNRRVFSQLIPWKITTFYNFFFVENAAENFLYELKLLGSVKNVAKKPKEVLIEAYNQLFEKGCFKESDKFSRNLVSTNRSVKKFLIFLS